MKIYTLNNLKLAVGESEDALVKIAQKELGKNPTYFRILKKSLDARKKNDVRYVYSIEFSDVKPEEKQLPSKISSDKLPSDPIVVVGSGPAGLFCAVRLIERGFAPIVIERGDCVEEREKKCKIFFSGGALDQNSNVQFGEGGAGTFSDGKLNTQTHSPLNGEVIEEFIRFGAPQEISYLAKPHIGSDNLKNVVKNMREFIVENGGKVLFNTTLVDFTVVDGKISSVTVKSRDKIEKIAVSDAVFAIGHSARDTFSLLKSKGVAMTAKNFAVGVRIEHLQERIGLAQYGRLYDKLPPADYKLVSHASERPTFTFCMCPGGYVMPATSENEQVVTNGMSNYARDNVNANSALIVAVTTKDYGSEDALAGVEFQRRLEKSAFVAGGLNYCAPVQRVEDFWADRRSNRYGEVLPSYERGVNFAKISDVLPSEIICSLKNALVDMDKKLKGFAHPDALLTAVESRTSSPVRIERDDSLQSVSVKNLYPCGEGAGYAGGITSSAADGLRIAEALFDKYSR